MRVLEPRELQQLIQSQPYPCISIYLGLGETPSERRAAPARLRSLVRVADAALAQTATDGKPALLAPLVSRAETALDRVPGDARGVALFRSFRTAALFPLDQAAADYVAVNDTFHLKPLLPTLQGLDAYHAVVLSPRRIRLYRGNEHRLSLAAAYDAPVDSEIAPARRLRRTRGAARGRVGRHQVPRLPTPARLEAFVRDTERKIRLSLTGTGSPVVLVGSPHMRRLYRDAAGPLTIAPEEVSAALGAHELHAIHQLTWPIARRELAGRAEFAKAAFRRAEDGPHASDDLTRIAEEALHGRVSHVLLSREDHVFGRLDRATGAITLAEPELGEVGDDVLCDIAQEVLLRGGRAILLPKHEMPTGAPAAALFRW